MNRWHALLCRALVLAAAGCATVPAPVPPPEGVDAEISELVSLVNSHRLSLGCPPLRWDAPLAAVAQRYSEDMAGRGFYGHTDPEGRAPADRLEEAGIPWRMVGENIARTELGAEQVFFLWLQSTRHRAQIEECRFTHHGVGLNRGLWTHLFIRPPPG